MNLLAPVQYVKSRLAERASNKALEARVAQPLLLKEFLLPERHGSVNVGRPNTGAALNIDPDQVKAEGYDGIRIKPAKAGTRTHVTCSSHDGITVRVTRRPDFVVVMEDLNIDAGFSMAVLFGEENKPVRPVQPGFELRAYRCSFYAPPPTEHGRTKWLVMGNQNDALFVDCMFQGYNLSEHDHYGHGSAGKGWAFIGCRFVNSGAEQIKVRSDTTETAYAGPNVRLIVRDCTFEDWYQDHSDRGGAGIVVQGGALHGLVERCVFRAGEGTALVPANARAHCIMVSSEGLSYDIDTGREGGTGFGNGHWVIRDCALWAHSEVPWRNEIVRIGRVAGSQKAAKSVRIQRCVMVGQQVILAVTDVASIKVEGCNTPELLARARAELDMDTRFEATIPTATQRVLLSKGFSR